MLTLFYSPHMTSIDNEAGRASGHAWDRHHQLLREATRPLSADQLALRAAPQLRSVGELVAHVIDSPPVF